MSESINEIVYIIDQSGSMEGMGKNVVRGFNKVLKEYKNMDGTIFLSTILFSEEITTIHDRTNIKKSNKCN